ncbi:hypothetical protein AMTR_s00061p00168280 [Amborella trichopoda]|uniref:Uncharacterized protein n=1 Tax=Amborella trichopoda TaxID=13333 RepID=U5D9J2_AMBTC|nr:hypothetical protein AMTR_s00061p00168280 [Amborella trichopoda]
MTLQITLCYYQSSAGELPLLLPKRCSHSTARAPFATLLLLPESTLCYYESAVSFYCQSTLLLFCYYCQRAPFAITRALYHSTARALFATTRALSESTLCYYHSSLLPEIPECRALCHSTTRVPFATNGMDMLIRFATNGMDMPFRLEGRTSDLDRGDRRNTLYETYEYRLDPRSVSVSILKALKGT